jgi:hypothetical protein
MWPTQPLPIRVPFTPHEAAERATGRRQRRHAARCPAPLVAAVALGLFEVEAGVRPPRQLEPLCHPDLWQRLDTCLIRGGGPAITGDSLRLVVLQEPSPGLVEGVAVVRRGGRVEPVAMRLELTPAGRWQVTVLQFASAAWPLGRPGMGPR